MTILRSRPGRYDLLRLALGLLAALWLGLAGQIAQAQATGPAAPRKVALIIGNSSYVNLGALPNPVNDADLVADAARKAGFQVVTVRKDLGLQAFRQSLREFETVANGAEMAMVYYAGHGISSNGINYLIPVDANLPDSSELEGGAVSLSYVMARLAGAQRRMILLDACRDNPLRKVWGNDLERPGLGETIAPANSVILFATKPGSFTPDGEGVNSLFALALAKYLPQPGLPLNDLGQKVADDVFTASERFQTPYSSIGPGLGEYSLMPVLKAEPPEDPTQRDFAAWGKADKEGTALAYNEYLRQFPNGQFADQARNYIKALCRNNPNCMEPPDPPPPPPPEPKCQPNDPRPSCATEVKLCVQNDPRPDCPLPPPPPPPPPPPDNCATNLKLCTNLPQIPEAPVFARGSFPTCKDDWKGIKDPVQAVASVNACLTAYFTYKSSTLDKFLSDLAAYQEVVNGLNLQVQGTDKPYSPEEQKRFFNEAQRLFREQQPGGSLRKLHEATSTEWERDVVYLKDSYNRATGCAGYPTPSGLAKTTFCPYN